MTLSCGTISNHDVSLLHLKNVTRIVSMRATHALLRSACETKTMSPIARPHANQHIYCFQILCTLTPLCNACETKTVSPPRLLAHIQSNIQFRASSNFTGIWPRRCMRNLGPWRLLLCSLLAKQCRQFSASTLGWKASQCIKLPIFSLCRIQFFRFSFPPIFLQKLFAWSLPNDSIFQFQG